MAIGDGVRINGSDLIEVTIGKMVFEETRQLADPDVAFGLFFNLAELSEDQKDALRDFIRASGDSVNSVALGRSHKRDEPCRDTEEEEEPEE
jgi:hypothetical protein